MTTAADKIFVLKVERARRHAKVMASTSYYANKSLSWLKIGQIKKKRKKSERGEKNTTTVSLNVCTRDHFVGQTRTLNLNEKSQLNNATPVNILSCKHFYGYTRIYRHAQTTKHTHTLEHTCVVFFGRKDARRQQFHTHTHTHCARCAPTFDAAIHPQMRDHIIYWNNYTHTLVYFKIISEIFLVFIMQSVCS